MEPEPLFSLSNTFEKRNAAFRQIGKAAVEKLAAGTAASLVSAVGPGK
jgi:hypothetical protein